jgi:hypothetical protein
MDDTEMPMYLDGLGLLLIFLAGVLVFLALACTAAASPRKTFNARPWSKGPRGRWRPSERRRSSLGTAAADPADGGGATVLLVRGAWRQTGRRRRRSARSASSRSGWGSSAARCRRAGPRSTGSAWACGLRATAAARCAGLRSASWDQTMWRLPATSCSQ